MIQQITITNDLLPTISIIIPTHNRAAFVGDTIQSFVDQDYPKEKYEIIIVDNNSTDNTPEVLKKFTENESPKIKYYFEKRTGTVYARNGAAKIAENEIIYLVDDDVIADKLLLREIIKPFLLDPRVATVTGRVLPRWQTEPPKWIKRYCQNRWLSLLDPPEDLVISNQLNYLYSCHQAVRRDVYMEVGGLNPESFGTNYLGDGETGLNIKIRQRGYLFAYNGKSVTYHVMPHTRFTQTYLNRRFKNSGRAQAYTDFRKGKKTQLSIIPMVLKASFIYVPFIYLTNILNLLKYKDANITRFFLANTFYYRDYLRYSWWLFSDKKWREYALKSDWLNDENRFNNDISSREK